MITKAIVAFFIFFILAFIDGKWADIILKKLGAKGSVVFRLAFGGCAVMLLGMVSCFAGALLSLSPGVCLLTAAVLICIAGIGAFITQKRSGTKNGEYSFEKPDRTVLILELIAALLIVSQIAGAVLFKSDRTEAIRCVATATSVYETGHLSLSDPMMLFIGCISAVTAIHPLNVVFALSPAPLIILYYLCYTAVADRVCSRRGSRMAVIAAALLSLWGYQSDVLIPVTLLLSWFGIWVYIVHGVMSIAAVLLILYLRGRPERPADTEGEDIDDDLEEWDMNRHKIINARNLAIALGVIACVLIGAVIVLNNKINRLYDATVNLQADMNSRCSVYEFAPDPGTSAGYLLRESDGTLTFIGGGPAGNADALGSFLDEYGKDIAKWYAYGDDEADSGAMRQLMTSQEVHVDRVYVIDAKEMTELK